MVVVIKDTHCVTGILQAALGNIGAAQNSHCLGYSIGHTHNLGASTVEGQILDTAKHGSYRAERLCKIGYGISDVRRSLYATDGLHRFGNAVRNACKSSQFVRIKRGCLLRYLVESGGKLRKIVKPLIKLLLVELLVGCSE